VGYAEGFEIQSIPNKKYINMIIYDFKVCTPLLPEREIELFGVALFFKAKYIDVKWLFKVWR